MKDSKHLPPRDYEVPGTWQLPSDPVTAQSMRRQAHQRALARDLRDMRALEQQHLARREAAPTDQERATADALLTDIQAQIADTQRRYSLMKVNKDGGKIRDEFAQKVREIAEALKASQHEGYTAEYRDGERQRLNAEYSRVMSHYRALMDQWLEQQATVAQAHYAEEPAGDTATEIRRLRFRDEVRSLVEEYAGDAQKTRAKNILLPEARRLAQIGALDRAHIYAEAARRLGVQDGALDTQIKEHLDRTIPHRREAIEALQAVQSEHDAFRIDAVKFTSMYGFGTVAQQMVAAENANFLEWKRKREDAFIAAANGGQAEPVTADPDEADLSLPTRSA